jgi:hypothetical protein
MTVISELTVSSRANFKVEITASNYTIVLHGCSQKRTIQAFAGHVVVTAAAEQRRAALGTMTRLHVVYRPLL